MNYRRYEGWNNEIAYVRASVDPCEAVVMTLCIDCGGELERKRHREGLSDLCRACSQVRRGLVDEDIRVPVAASWAEIAADLGVSSSYVRQIYQGALRKLARRPGLRKLLAMMMEEP